MDFLRILRSLEEFLYEVMTWLIFYPRTMWRAVREPLTMLRYSDRELKDAPDEQFTETLSPPLFLMITILLSHLIEIASHSAEPLKPHTAFAREMMASDQNLLILRSILFAIYPLMFAMRRLSRQRSALTRDTLRAPFYAQCFIAAPAAFTLGIAAILGRSPHPWTALAGLVLALLAVGWYLGVETTWLHRQARISRWAAFRSVFATWLAASLINSVISFLVLGSE
jgi:hypothetical protein